MSQCNLAGLALCITLAGIPSFFTSTYLYAQTGIQHFRIPAGALDAAMLEASRQSGQLVVFEPSALARHSTEGLEGDFTLDQLLRRLLDGQSLGYTRDARGAILIHVNSAGSLILPSTDVYGQQDMAGGLASYSTSTTRTGAPLQLTPQSVNVINNEIMDAQGARTVSDALQNISGVTVLPSSLGSTSVNVRGHTASVLSEGLAATAGSTPYSVPAFALEAVEVLKGPGAILTGAGSPGGTINLVYKKPQRESAHEISIGYGSYDERLLSLDSTGALSDDGRLSYRVILDGKESRRNAANYDGHHEFYFSPSIRWMDEETDFILRYSRIARTTPFSPYTILRNGKPYTGNLPEPLGNEEDSLRLQQNEFHYSLEQALGEHWQLFSKGTYTQASFEQFGWYSYIFQPAGASNDVWLNSFGQGGDYRQWNLDNYVRGSYQWGDLQSTSVFGISATQTRADSKSFPQVGWYQVDITEPLPTLPSARTTYTESFSESRPLGVYWQQLLDYGKWHLNGSLRFNSSWYGLFRRDEASDSEKRQVWSPSIGVAYEVTPWLTAYASHLRGYQPPSYRDRNGELLSEQTSKQNEAGLKFSLLDQRLNVTTSVYRIEFDNYAIQGSDRFWTTTKGYISRGFEIDFQGSLTDNIDLVGNYNNSRSEFAEDETLHAATPKQRASLWGRYQFRQPILKGLSASIGLHYTGAAYLDKDEKYEIPSQLQTNIGLGYVQGSYSLDLIARNIFDEDLYVTSMNGDPTAFVPLQQPREFQLTASYRF